MKSRKLLVFVINELALLGVLVAIFFFASSSVTTLVPWAIGALVANGAAYATGNVVSKAIVSKHYQEGLNDANPQNTHT